MLNRPDYNPWEDLVLSVLSTGGYRMERTYQHREMLIKNGLTDPCKINSFKRNVIAKKLVQSGYNRGPALTAMYTERLFAIGQLSNNIEKYQEILTKGTSAEVESLLKDVYGIGPVVIRYFLTLRDGKKILEL